MQMTPLSNVLDMQQQWERGGNPSRAQKLYFPISCLSFQPDTDSCYGHSQKRQAAKLTRIKSIGLRIETDPGS